MDMNRLPTVSILIPCYNVDQYISQCVESILAQTYPHLEMICVNDGSTDQTVHFLQKYAKQDQRVILLNQPNQGISAARNAGLAITSGELVMFVDADDWLDINAISILLGGYKDEDIVVFSYTREFKSTSLSKDLYLNGIYPAEFIQRRLLGPLNEEKARVDSLDSLAPVWGKMYKKSILPQHLNFKDLGEIGTWEDGFFNIEILNNCKKVLVVNKPLYHYRKSNTASFTSIYKENLQHKWVLKFQLLGTVLKEHGKDKSYFTALNNRVCLTFLGLCLNEINSGAPFFVLRKKINHLLNDHFYREAFCSFNLKFLPFHWKLFYYFAKVKFSYGVTALAVLIHFIINRKNQ